MPSFSSPFCCSGKSFALRHFTARGSRDLNSRRCSRTICRGGDFAAHFWSVSKAPLDLLVGCGLACDRLPPSSGQHGRWRCGVTEGPAGRDPEGAGREGEEQTPGDGPTALLRSILWL